MYQTEVIENLFTQAIKLVDLLLESLTTTFVSCTREINYTSHILLQLNVWLCVHVIGNERTTELGALIFMSWYSTLSDMTSDIPISGHTCFELRITFKVDSSSSVLFWLIGLKSQ